MTFSPLSVHCPDCKARPGEKCKYPSGGVASRTHIKRRHRANIYGAPKGYVRGSEANVSAATPFPGWVCTVCGAVIASPSLHDAWHRGF